jgi:deoxyribonuclease V
MLIAVDVQYRENIGFSAGVLFEDWKTQNEFDSYICITNRVNDYVPGQFYRRELPCIMNLLENVHQPLSCIVIDGFVFLDGFTRPGLGKYLYDALGKNVPIIGVAKSSFYGTDNRFAIYRGDSKKPLYITSIGYSLEVAKNAVAEMDGPYRLPTLLKRVDQLCRGAADSG